MDTLLIILVGMTGIILFQLKCLDFTYLFQIKEYRFDRFSVFIKETGFLKIFYMRTPRIPAKTLRNAILIGISWLFAIPLLIVIPLFAQSYFGINALVSMMLMIVTIPFTSFAAIALTVILTNIAAKRKRAMLIEQATKKLAASKTVVIGVTGSYGKSSVKEFLYAILSRAYKTAKTDENMNTDVGVALSILKNCNADTEYFIAEMGAYRIGEIKAICDFTHPKYGILTAIGNQHLALFGSLENLMKAKKEMAESLPQDGVFYLNSEIVTKEFFLNGLRCKSVVFGKTEPEASYELVQPAATVDTPTPFRIRYNGRTIELRTSLVGEQNIQNLLAAVIVAIDLGVGETVIKDVISRLKNLSGKLSTERGIRQSLILNDVYSSNVNGFIAAVTNLRLYPHKKQFIATRGLIELGTEKKQSYEKIITEINKSGSMLLTTDSDFVNWGMGERGLYFSTEEEMIRYLNEQLDNDSIVLVEGRFPESFIKAISL